LTGTQIEGITTTVIAALSTTTLGTLTTDQLSDLTVAQAQTIIGTGQYNSLSAAQQAAVQSALT
jgi:hypothetical protein